MLILEPKPLYAPCPMEDAAADQRAARKIQQYRFGERAVFLPAFPDPDYQLALCVLAEQEAVPEICIYK